MDTNRILAELRAERDRIDQAISALEAVNSTGRRTVVRPSRAMRKHRTVSAAARARMAAAQRARWAKEKPAQSRTPIRRMSQAARRRRGRLSTAARTKLSRLLKQRWSQGKMKPRAKRA
jgi:hypothetical protein